MIDALHFWQAGAKLLAGQSPYGVDFAYPVIVAYFLALLTWMPVIEFQIVMLVGNALVLVALVGKRAPLWVAYAPILSILLYGQVDLLLVWLESRLKDNKRSAFWAAVITLKPQLALILLPPHLWRWRKTRTGLWFLLFAAALWGLPFIIYREWIGDWFHALAIAPSGRVASSPSLWAVLNIWALPLVIALAWWMVRKQQWSRPAAELALPVGGPYSAVVLTGVTLWLIPLSWLPFALGDFYSQAWILPLAALIYQTRASWLLRRPQAAARDIEETLNLYG